MARASAASLREASTDGDGSEPEGQKRRQRILSITAALRAACSEHPLTLGAVLLFVVSSVAAHASWGFPTSVQATLGGGVEVVEVDYQHTEFDEAFIVSASPFGRYLTEEEVLSSVDEDEPVLVSVPWTPVLPESASRRGVVEHTVAQGESLSFISNKYGVSVPSVALSNDIVDPDSIQPGDVFRIPPRVKGATHVLLHTVKEGQTVAGLAKRYSADADQIIVFNGLPADGTLIAGKEIVIPVAELPEFLRPKPAPPRIVSSAPRYASSPVPYGYYIAPTTGRNYGRIHSNNGVDIANSCGTPVYAAAAGSVGGTYGASYGWNGGYGNVIDLVHGNGTSTRYAHLSSIIVASGYVAQGQLIGLMGTTGRSTGCHLHFEVHGARNPLAR